MKNPPSLLALLLLFVIEAQATEERKIDSERKSEDSVEHLTVVGRRTFLNAQTEAFTEKLLDVPSLGNDPLAAIYTLPGVVQVPYDTVDPKSGPSIRGSSPTDNAYYIDFMPAGFVFHTFLGNSVFNENLIRKFDLKSSSFDARYGEAIGAVIDVSLRDPRNQDFMGVFDWSMLQTGIMLESGVSNNSAFYLSYQEALLHLFLDEGEDEDDPGFVVNNVPRSNNYQFKYQWLISDEQKLTLGSNGASESAAVNIGEESEDGRADPDQIGDAHIDVKYDSLGFLWELFAHNGSRLSVSLSHLDNFREFFYGGDQYEITRKKTDFLHVGYEYGGLNKHKFLYGLEVRRINFQYDFDMIPYYCTDHTRDCTEQRSDRLDGVTSFKRSTEVLYLMDYWSLSHSVGLELGLRLENKSHIDESVSMPRVALVWNANDWVSLDARFGRYERAPDDDFAVNILGNPNLKSPRADHRSIGAELHMNELWQLDIDVYNKQMSRLPLVLQENDPNYNLHYSNELSGNARGVEIMLKRERKKEYGWHGWVSIAWSESERTNERTGTVDQFHLDTPWIINWVLQNDSESGWEFGLAYTFRSGQRYTPIIGIRENEHHRGNYLPIYGELNSKELPPTYRLDLRAAYNFLAWGKDAAWTFALLNASDRDNVEAYYLLTDGSESLDNFTVDTDTDMERFLALGFKLTF